MIILIILPLFLPFATTLPPPSKFQHISRYPPPPIIPQHQQFGLDPTPKICWCNTWILLYYDFFKNKITSQISSQVAKIDPGTQDSTLVAICHFFLSGPHIPPSILALTTPALADNNEEHILVNTAQRFSISARDGESLKRSRNQYSSLINLLNNSGQGRSADPMVERAGFCRQDSQGCVRIRIPCWCTKFTQKGDGSGDKEKALRVLESFWRKSKLVSFVKHLLIVKQSNKLGLSCAKLC